MDTVTKILDLIFSPDVVNVQLGLTLAASQRTATKDKILFGFIDRLLWSVCDAGNVSIIKDKTCWYGPRLAWVTISGRVGLWNITIQLDTDKFDDAHSFNLLDGDRCRITYQYAPTKFDIVYRCLYTAIHYMNNSTAYKEKLYVKHSVYKPTNSSDQTGTYVLLHDKSSIYKQVTYRGIRYSRKIYSKLLKLIQR